MADRDTLARLLFIQRHPLAQADRARRWDQQMLVEHEPIDAYREADAILASDWLAARVDAQIARVLGAADVIADLADKANAIETVKAERDDLARVLEEAQGEIARLRDMLHDVERMDVLLREARAERDRLGGVLDRLLTHIGSCTCNIGPETDGPSEDCPQHGRPYSYWVDRSNAQAVTLEKVRALAERGTLRDEADERGVVGDLAVDVADLTEILGSSVQAVERCDRCGHAPHDSLGFCPNMASDNDCSCTRSQS